MIIMLLGSSLFFAVLYGLFWLAVMPEREEKKREDIKLRSREMQALDRESSERVAPDGGGNTILIGLAIFAVACVVVPLVVSLSSQDCSVLDVVSPTGSRRSFYREEPVRELSYRESSGDVTVTQVLQDGRVMEQTIRDARSWTCVE